MSNIARLMRMAGGSGPDPWALTGFSFASVEKGIRADGAASSRGVLFNSDAGESTERYCRISASI